jgi:hypothetical protein
MRRTVVAVLAADLEARPDARIVERYADDLLRVEFTARWLCPFNEAGRGRVPNRRCRQHRAGPPGVAAVTATSM